MRGLPYLLLLIMTLALPAVQLSAADDDLARVKERELEQVRKQIAELKKRMDKSAKERDRLNASLQQIELEIATARSRLADLEQQRQASEQERKDLDAELARREAELKAEQQQLAEQARAAYTSGGQERIKLMLNQQDPATLGRVMVYYRYLSDFRGANIEAVNNTLAELARLRQAVVAEEQKLVRLAQDKRAEVNKLDAVQAERQELVTAVQQKLLADDVEVRRLQGQEKDLARLIQELSSILAFYPINSEEPFSALKGKLTWPVAGRLVQDFGQPRARGRMKWNGVVLAAPRGREVRAIYHGRVVFADWLAGMGLLIIVDHGEGYLTLYGHTETLLKSAGDWVAPGDVLATVGDSGGQVRSGLYFELRKGRQPVNPRHWVSRTPKQD